MTMIPWREPAGAGTRFSASLNRGGSIGALYRKGNRWTVRIMPPAPFIPRRVGDRNGCAPYSRRAGVCLDMIVLGARSWRLALLLDHREPVFPCPLSVLWIRESALARRASGRRTRRSSRNILRSQEAPRSGAQFLAPVAGRAQVRRPVPRWIRRPVGVPDMGRRLLFQNAEVEMQAEIRVERILAQSHYSPFVRSRAPRDRFRAHFRRRDDGLHVVPRRGAPRDGNASPLTSRHPGS